MSEIFNIIKNSLRSNNFYIPSCKSYVKGCSLTVKQLQEFQELDSAFEYGFEKYVRFAILSDKVIFENLESTKQLLSTDKPFILNQIKMSQESNFLGLSLQDYISGIKERYEITPLFQKTTEFKYNNLTITFDINTFDNTKTISQDFLNILENNFNNSPDIISFEIIKSLKSISFENTELNLKEVKLLKELIDNVPASVIETFNEYFRYINDSTKKINTFKIKESDFVFNPTLELMLL